MVEALTFSLDDWLGQHVFKAGLDLQHSRFDGDNYSQEVDVVRLDGSLAERTTYTPPLVNPEVSGTEFAMFVQDRWRVNDRLSFELGMRVDFDDIVEGVNYSPRAGMSVSLLPEGRGILRGGFGKFSERTPLTIGAFTQYDVQTVSRFAADGATLGAPVTFVHVLDGKLKTPESIVETVAWDQRFGRRFFFKAAYLHRDGSHAYTINPDPSRGVLTLGSVGESEYWELETTGRFLASEYRDLSVSYVRSHGTRDLNDYDQFYGNFRNPIIRFNANSLNPTDVPNRLIVRGTIGLPGKLGLLAHLRVADRVSVVGGERIPGFRRRTQQGGTTADSVDARLHARPAVALPEVSLHGGAQGLQRVRRRQRARRAEQHHIARLRQVLQSDSALDRLRFWHHTAVTPWRSWTVSDARVQPRGHFQGRTTLSRGTRRRSSLSTSSGSRLA